MNKRNFNFYLSKSSQPRLLRGWEVDDNGNHLQTDDVTKYIIGYSIIGDVKGFYFDFDATSPYHAILFFDENKSLIKLVTLQDHPKQLILVPANATHYYARFTSEDSAFEKARTTDFMFLAERINPYYKKLEKKLAKAAGQEYYTETLEGQIKLVGDDFSSVYNSNINTRFLLTIMDAGVAEANQYYNGTFCKTNCKFDCFKMTCTPKLQTADSYKVVLDRYKDKFNLVKLGVPVSRVACTKRPFMQIYIDGSDSVTNIFNGQSWEVDVTAAPENKEEITKQGFAEIKQFREVYIEAVAAHPEINGIYSEWEKSSRNLSNGVEYTLNIYKLEKVTRARTHCIQIISRYGQGGSGGWAYIFSVKNPSTILYTAELGSDIVAGMASEYGSIQNLAFRGSDGDVFFITKDISYTMYARVVHNNKDLGSRLSHDDFAAVNTKAYKYCTSLSGEDISILQSTDAVSRETPYGVNDYEEYFTPEFLPALSAEDRYVPVGKSDWANSSLWLAYENNTFNQIDTEYSTQFLLRDAYSVSDVINALLKAIGSDVTHTLLDSAFLNYPGAYTQNSYFNRILITQKTNMIYGTYDQAAQKVEVSLESIMNMLRDCFRCYWYISNKSLKVEHVSYFINGRSYEPDSREPIDLYSCRDIFNRQSVTYGQGEISYDLSGLTRKYKFSYGDESLSPFTGVELDVNAHYIQADKTEDISINDYSADIDFMQISADQVSQDGFALLCAGLVPETTDPYDYRVAIDELSLVGVDGKAYKTRVQNGLASWAELVKLYSWDMPAYDVTCNVLASYTVNGIKPIKQLSIRTPYMANLTPFDRIKTPFLEGQIESVSENIDTGYLSIDIRGSRVEMLKRS